MKIKLNRLLIPKNAKNQGKNNENKKYVTFFVFF